MPVAPVFWAATDDADFDEAAVVSISLDDGAHELRLESRAPAGTPMSRVPMDDEIPRCFRRCEARPHRRPRVVRRRGGAGVSLRARRSATRTSPSCRDVLQPIGIAVLDASHPCVTQAGARLLRAAAAQAEQVSAALHTRTEAIRAAGFAPQVEEVPGSRSCSRTSRASSVASHCRSTEARRRSTALGDRVAASRARARDPSRRSLTWRAPARSRISRR
jgi:uncharacterized protein YllA (UPF0747 family)